MKGHVYDRDGRRKVIAQLGGTEAAPLLAAVDVDAEGNVRVGDLTAALPGLPPSELAASLAGWADLGHASRVFGD